MSERPGRRSLWRWLGWFGMANAVVLGLVALNYLGGGGSRMTALSVLYTVTIYVSNYTLLALAPLVLLIGPLILLMPRRALVTAAGAAWFAILVAVLVLDSLLWSQGRFHLNLLTAQILGWQSWVFVGVMFCIALVFELILAQRVWAWLRAAPRRGGGRLAWVITVCFVIAQGIHVWADANYYIPVTSVAQRLPVHGGFSAKKFLTRTGLVDVNQARERELASRVARGLNQELPLAYPQAPLQCANEEPANVLLILLDAWRFDMLDPTLMPELTAWADRRAVRFERHYSGGNSSRMGVFTFFYGLPPSYFESIEAVQQPALLIGEAQRQGYAMGLFTSSDMYRPVMLDRTAFATVPDLQVTPPNPAAPAWQRDQDLLDLWRDFLDGRDPQKPFLGFLFFDSTNAMVTPEEYLAAVGADPEDPSNFDRYRAATHYLDALVGAVLADLSRRGLADETVVVISADHGEEFGESGEAFQLHGSGYSRYQVQVPLLLSLPGLAPGVVETRTSHYDVAPTLMGRVLGCRNDPADYSSGADLLTRPDWSWLLAASYYNYAVLEPDRVTVTFPSGLFEVRDANYQLIDAPRIDGDVLQAVMHENRRFHR